MNTCFISLFLRNIFSDVAISWRSLFSEMLELNLSNWTTDSHSPVVSFNSTQSYTICIYTRGRDDIIFLENCSFLGFLLWIGVFGISLVRQWIREKEECFFTYLKLLACIYCCNNRFWKILQVSNPFIPKELQKCTICMEKQL